MDLKTYFDTTKGVGVMATSDAAGNVDAAVYARPQVLADGTVAAVMRDRLTHKNLETNPKAAYLFMEEGPGYKGRRLFLKKVKEETDPSAVEKYCRRCYPPHLAGKPEERFVVIFEVEKVLPLVGSGQEHG